MNEILNYLPNAIKDLIYEETKEKWTSLEEIRIRVAKPIVLKYSESDKVIKHLSTTEEVLSCLQKFCENSIYSYQNQIADGFITIKGGHRIGISGSCVIENGKVINIKYVYSLNIRIAKQILGSSNQALRYVLDLDKNSVYNTLIVSGPGTGKTTILRDIVRQISSRNKGNKIFGYKCRYSR